METIRHILTRYTAFLWAMLKPLGVWGAFGFAAVDSAFLAMPLDAVVAGYVYSHPSRFLLYAFMAASGSAIGSLILYSIGYKGGEMLLLKRISRERFDDIRNRFESREFWALMIPSMLPPPAPFKLFVLSAGVFEMHPMRFMLAIFTGRMVRFIILSILTLEFGPEIVGMVGTLLREHLWLAIVVFVIAAGVLFLLYLLWRRPIKQLEQELQHEQESR